MFSLSSFKGDRFIWIISIFLMMISVLVVYSSTSALAYRSKLSTELFLAKQVIFCLIGLIIMRWFAKTDYRTVGKYANIGIIVGIFLLIMAKLFPADVNHTNVDRWVRIPVVNVTIQASEPAKLLLMNWLAIQLSMNQDKLNVNKFFWLLLGVVGACCGLIVGSNLSTAILLFGNSMLIMFIGRIPWSQLMKGVFVAALAGVVFFGYKTLSKEKATDKSVKENKDRSETWKSRWKGFWEDDLKAKKPTQIFFSKMAIATGGFIGKGPGNSEERNFLPEAYTDFIYSIIIEEYGMIGGVIVSLLYLGLLYRILMVAKKTSPNSYGCLLVSALGISMITQSMVNMGVATGLGPVTGQVLPFISMGGTAMWMTCCTVGMILSVSRHLQEEREQLKNEIPYADV
jgi:cell division protein FtsW